MLARNLFEGGFTGPIMPVNPHEATIRSAVNYRAIKDLPVTPDLAVVATPPATVPGIIAELGLRGCRAAVVITAGFGEGEEITGAALREKMLEAARPTLMRIVGPNCLGFISPARGINATFAHLAPAAGDIAFITQSGAIATALIDWAAGRSFGFSHLVSLGDMTDVDFGDLLDYLALDRATRAILLYVESVTSARKFMSAARIASRAKPVIVVKGGRTQAGARAAVSHTGALAGADAVYDAAFRRAGMLRVYELRELFEAAEMLATGMRVKGDRLSILTNGGGAGVLAADALEERGGRLASAFGGGESGARCRAAEELVARQSRRHGGRRIGRPLYARARHSHAAGRAGCDPRHELPDRHRGRGRGGRGGDRGARGGFRGGGRKAGAASHLLARRGDGGRSAQALLQGEAPDLRDARRGRASLHDARALPAQSGIVDGDAVRGCHDRGRRAPARARRLSRASLGEKRRVLTEPEAQDACLRSTAFR